MQIVVLILSIIVFLLVIIGLIVYTMFKLKKDLIIFKKSVPNLPGSTTNGLNGIDGISAYQQYLNDHPSPALTESQFNNLFTGSNGIDGANAPAALDGLDADSGSDGDHGEMGIIGINGEKGAPGMKGIHGETFINFYDGAPVPTGITNYCLIDNTNLTVEYIEDSTVKFAAKIRVVPGLDTIQFIEPPYISFVLYNDDNKTIKGITGPMIIPIIGNLGTVHLDTYAGTMKFRYIISPNKHSTISSFSRHITDEEYNDKEITYSKNEEKDPFVVKLYNLLRVNPILQYNVDKLEQIFISKKYICSTLDIEITCVYF